jgi:hypothetical protein
MNHLPNTIQVLLVIQHSDLRASTALSSQLPTHFSLTEKVRLMHTVEKSDIPGYVLSRGSARNLAIHFGIVCVPLSLGPD